MSPTERTLCFWSSFLASYYLLSRLSLFGLLLLVVLPPEGNDPSLANGILWAISFPVPFAFASGSISSWLGSLQKNIFPACRWRWLWLSFLGVQISLPISFGGLKLLDLIGNDENWAELIRPDFSMLASESVELLEVWLFEVAVISLAIAWKKLISRTNRAAAIV